MSEIWWKAIAWTAILAGMNVIATETYVSENGDRRARICERPDGLFQCITETLQPEDGESFAYWTNDYPPSGLFADKGQALVELKLAIPSPILLKGIKPVSFDPSVGPYPEPGP